MTAQILDTMKCTRGIALAYLAELHSGQTQRPNG